MELPPDEGGRRLEWALPDLLKRGILAGIGALFMTEDGVRSILGELKLPKEAAQFVINQVGKTKEDLFRMIASEIRGFLDSTNISEELRKALTGMSLEISTTVRFKPDQEKIEPVMKSSVKVKKKGRKKKSKKKV
jgi:hypothetical protein